MTWNLNPSLSERLRWRGALNFAVVLAIAAVVGVAAPHAARAATPDAGQAGQGGSATSTVGELIVTATRREEDIRRVPSTIRAVTGEAIANAGPIQNVGDVLQTVPGVRFNNLQSPILSEISIRGSGTERATGAESGVGLFVNGAYVGGGELAGRSFTNLDYFDINRVEVLEGAQGALYGRDAEFGVINIVPNEPSFSNSGYVDESYTFETQANVAQGVVNFALNDDWALRVGVEDYAQSGGFYYNPDSKTYYDQTNGWLGRVQLRYKHGPWDIDLLLDHEDLNLPQFVGAFDLQPNQLRALIHGFTQDRFVIPHGVQDGLSEQVSNAFLTAKYDFGWGVLTSTTLARSRTTALQFGNGFDLAQEAQVQRLGDVGVYPFAQADQNDKADIVYEELHLTGVAADDRLNWLVGGDVLWQKDDTNGVQIANPCVLKVGAGICGGTPAQHLCYLPLPTSTPCPATYPGTFGSTELDHQTYNSESIYASLSYKLADFTLAVAGRYAYDTKKATRDVYATYTTDPYTYGTGGVITNPTYYSLKGGQPTYTVTLSYAVPGSWNGILYGKVGTGYRTGGLNFGDSPPVAPVTLVPTYQDETTISYEAGLKGNLTQYAYFSIVGYYSETQNALASTTDGCQATNACKQAASVFVINGGTVRAHGIEAEFDFRFDVAGGPLNVQLTGSGQTARYVNVDAVAGVPIIIPNSLVAQNPAWLASATVNYRHAIANDWDGFVNLVYHGQWGGVQDAVTITLPAQPLASINNIDLRLGVDHKPFEVALFIQNLTDESVPLLYANIPTTSSISGTYANQTHRWNEPRTIGLEAKYKW